MLALRASRDFTSARCTSHRLFIESLPQRVQGFRKELGKISNPSEGDTPPLKIFRAFWWAVLELNQEKVEKEADSKRPAKFGKVYSRSLTRPCYLVV
jgi:hypothetical protein